MNVIDSGVLGSKIIEPSKLFIFINKMVAVFERVYQKISRKI